MVSINTGGILGCVRVDMVEVFKDIGEFDVILTEEFGGLGLECSRRGAGDITRANGLTPLPYSYLKADASRAFRIRCTYLIYLEYLNY